MLTKPNPHPSRSRELPHDRSSTPSTDPEAKARPPLSPPDKKPSAPSAPADSPRSGRQTEAAVPEEIETKHIPLELIDESDRLRLRIPPYRGIPELAESIKRNDQLAPLYVRANGPQYELISGYRRLSALKLLGKPTAFCRIFRDISDSKAYDIAILENEDKDDMSVLERGQICLRLQSDGKTAEEIACRFGWTNRRNVYHHYRLAKEASAALRETMQAANSRSTSRSLIDTKAAELGDAVEREILQTVIENEMSVREARNHVARIRRTARGEPRDGTQTRPSYIRDHKNGAFTISARIDPTQPQDLDDQIASVETALKRMKHLKKKAQPKSTGTTSPTPPASPTTDPKKGA